MKTTANRRRQSADRADVVTAGITGSFVSAAGLFMPPHYSNAWDNKKGRQLSSGLFSISPWCRSYSRR
jgi:hypothetical protein